MGAVVLSIAGSDPSGGAGVQGDLKTFAALGVYGAAAVTAVTVQDTRRVGAIHAVPAGHVRAQVEAVLSDLPVDAVKTGMLARAEIVDAVAAALAARPVRFLVVDPVLASSSGVALLDAAGVERLRRTLLPMATLVTPNRSEAATLAGTDPGDGVAAAARLLSMGAGAVLLTGGDARGEDVVDLLVDATGVRELRRPRVHTRSSHGTGCALAAAAAVYLARGVPLQEAAEKAGRYVEQALATAPGLGRGRGPLHHLHPYWRHEDEEPA